MCISLRIAASKKFTEFVLKVVLRILLHKKAEDFLHTSECVCVSLAFSILPSLYEVASHGC